MSDITEPANGDLHIARARDLITSTIDGELFGLEVEDGHFFGFNGPATRIWELIDPPTTLDTLVAALVSEFAVEPDACRTATLTLLRDLERDGMVTLTPVAE